MRLISQEIREALSSQAPRISIVTWGWEGIQHIITVKFFSSIFLIRAIMTMTRLNSTRTEFLDSISRSLQCQSLMKTRVAYQDYLKVKVLPPATVFLGCNILH
jgi:hypothetical protein